MFSNFSVGVLNSLKFSVCKLEDAGERLEPTSYFPGDDFGGFVLDVVLNLGPCMLEDRTYLDLELKVPESLVFRQARAVGLQLGRSEPKYGFSATAPPSGLFWSITSIRSNIMPYCTRQVPRGDRVQLTDPQCGADGRFATIHGSASGRPPCRFVICGPALSAPVPVAGIAQGACAALSEYNCDMAKSRDKGNKEVKKPKKKK